MLTPNEVSNLGDSLKSIHESNASLAETLCNFLGIGATKYDASIDVQVDMDLEERGESDGVDHEDEDLDDGSGYEYSREFNSRG